MSTTIDQKVVEMRFDNKQFESNVATSMSTLEKLKRSLKLDGASKGLENIQQTAKKVDFSGMSRGVDAVTQKFSYMQMTIQHQLNNIVDSAVNAGKRMVSALTIDPIKSGFQEYETQINAIQTILANTESKGTTLDDVNNALDTLNTYADKTIYNFTEMTRNIGTFTAAGIDLDTSVNAIQGIANLAAVSGSNAQQASTAMYQLSQALASGTVKLMDWNSVVNAGMGGQVFQDALKETARVHGIAIDSMIKEQGSFRETLSKGWLTSEILTETLQKFTLTTEGLTDAQIEQNRQMLKSKGYTDDQIEQIFKLGETATNAATKVKTFTQLWDTLKEAAQSGWTQTWELIIGDFDEAKELLTGISDVVGEFINKTSDRRNSILGGALKSNYSKLISEINEAGISTDNFQNKVKELYDAANGDGSFDKLIEKTGSFEKACKSGSISSSLLKDALGELNGKLVDLSNVQENLKFGDKGEDVKKIQTALKQLNYDLGDFGEGGVDGIIGKYTEEAIKAFQEANNLEVTGIVDEKTLVALEEATTLTGKLSSKVSELCDGITELGGREKIIESLKNIFKGLVSVIKPIKTAFTSIFPRKSVEDASAQIVSLIDKFHNFTKKLTLNKEEARKVYETFRGLFSILDIISTITGGVLKTGFQVLSTILEAFDLNILDVTAAIGRAITAFHDWFMENNFVASALDGLVAKLPGLIDQLKQWWAGFKETEPVQNFVELLSKLKNMLVNLGTMQFDAESIKTWAKNFKKTFSDLLKTIPEIFKQLGKDIETGLDNLTGGKITAFKEWFAVFKESPQVEAFVTALGRIGTAIQNLLILIGDVTGITGFVEKIVDTVSSLPGRLGEMMSGAGENILAGLENGLAGGATGVITAILEVATNLINAFCDMLGIHSPSTEAESWGENIIQGLVNGIKNGIGAIADAIGEIGNTILQYAQKIPWDKILAFGISAAMVVTVKKIVDTIDAFANAFDGLGEIFKSTARVVDNVALVTKKFAGVISGISWDLKVEALKKLAISLGILTVAVIALAQVPLPDLAKGIGSIFLLAVILTILAVAVDKLSSASVEYEKGSGAKINNIKTGLLSIGLSMLALAAVMKIVGGMNVDEFNQGILGMAGLMTGLIGFIALFGVINKHLDTSGIDKLGGMLLKLSITMAIMVGVFKLAGMLELGDIGYGVACMVLFAAFLKGLVFATKEMDANINKIGGMMVKISFALLLMIGVVKLAGTLNKHDIIYGGAFLFTFTAFVALLVQTTKIAKDQEIAKLGGLLLSISVSLLLMIAVCKLVGMLSPGEIAAGVAFVIGFGLLVWGLKKVLTISNEQEMARLATTILAMSVGIAVMAGAAILLSLISLPALAKGVAAIAVLGLVMKEMIKATKDASNCKGNLIVMAVVIGVMAASVAALSMIDGTKLAGAVLALSILMGMFTLVEKSAKHVTGSMGTMIAMTVAVGLLGGIVAGLAFLPMESVLGSAAALSMLLISLGVSMKLMSGLKAPGKDALIAIGVMTGVVAILAVILGIMGALNVEPSIETALALSTLLIAMSTAALILSKMGMVAPGAITGAAGMILMIAGVATLISAIAGVLGSIPGVQTLFNNSIPILEAIGTGLGKAIGSFIGAIGEGVGAALTAVTEGLKGFVEGLKDVAVAASEVPSESFDGVNALVTALLGISVGAVVEKFASLITGESSIDTFKEQALSFITAISEISAAAASSPIDSAAMSAFASAGTAFSTLANSIPSTEGILQKITGIKDLGNFGTDVATYVGELKKVNDSLGADYTINAAAFSAFASVADPFVTLMDSIPATGGWKDKIVGVKDLGAFGSDVASYVAEIKLVAEALGDFTLDTTAFTTFATVGTSFAELLNSLPDAGGWIDKIKGVKDLGTFGTDIAAYVGELKTVGESLVDFNFDTTAFQTLVDAGTKMSELQSSLDNMGGVIDWFTGRSDLGTFGENIGTFAGAMTKLKEGMGEGGISEDVVSSITNAGNALLALNDALPTEGWFDGKITMSDFSDYISDFSTAIAGFGEKAAGIDATAIDNAINAAYRIRTLITTIADLDTSGISSFTGAGQWGDGAVGNIAEAMADFSEQVAEIDVAAVSTSVTAALKIRSLISALVNLDTSGIENFKPEKIGSAMSSYSNKVSGIDTGAVSKSIAAATRLRSFINSLTGLDSSGVVNFKPGSIGNALKTYSGAVASIDAGSVASSITIATRLKSFISSLSGLDTSGVSSFNSAVSSLAKTNISGMTKAFGDSASKMVSAGSNIMSGLSKGLSSSTSKVTSTVSDTASSMLKTITSKTSSFTTAGGQLMTALVSGIRSKAASVTSTVSSVAIRSASGIRSSYSSFYNNGAYLGSGLVIGIDSKRQAAWNAGYALGKAAADGEKAGQQSNSPSKLTIQAGKWLGEGLVIGIGRMTSKVYKAGYAMGDSAVQSISSTISGISDIVSSGFETNPTIRPVLDLSDVEAGAGTIGGMFDQNLAIGTSANLGAISSMMGDRSQNGANSDVVSAINRLSKQLGNVGGNTYNVNGITYDDGSSMSEAVQSIVRAARMERRI